MPAFGAPVPSRLRASKDPISTHRCHSRTACGCTAVDPEAVIRATVRVRAPEALEIVVA